MLLYWVLKLCPNTNQGNFGPNHHYGSSWVTVQSTKKKWGLIYLVINCPVKNGVTISDLL